nr:hypothetical protein BDOA9_0165900 [Bradyrhizobium sp. DOA9]
MCAPVRQGAPQAPLTMGLPTGGNRRGRLSEEPLASGTGVIRLLRGSQARPGSSDRHPAWRRACSAMVLETIANEPRVLVGQCSRSSDGSVGESYSGIEICGTA